MMQRIAQPSPQVSYQRLRVQLVREKQRTIIPHRANHGEMNNALKLLKKTLLMSDHPTNQPPKETLCHVLKIKI